MPFGVTKWPGPCDPRDACFCIVGYDDGAVPPYKYFLKTTGAMAPFLALNAGVLIHFEVGGGGDCIFFEFTTMPNVTYNLVTTVLGAPPFPPPPAATLRWKLTVVATATGESQEGEQSARLPFAVDQPPSILTLPAMGPTLIPNPVTIEPRPWDAV